MYLNHREWQQLKRRRAVRLESTTYTGPGADEEIVEAMARLVLERLKVTGTWQVRVGGWSGVGTRRVMDRVAAAISADVEGEKGDFSGCVRVIVNSYAKSKFLTEFEIRREIEQFLTEKRKKEREREQLLQFRLPAGNDTNLWRKIAITLKWKPLVATVENLPDEINWDFLGIPKSIGETAGQAKKDLLKLVFSSQWWKDIVDCTWVENEFDDLSDEVAIQMLLYEARSAATETKDKYYQSVVEESTALIQEKVTSMTFPSLAPSAFLHQDNLDRLKGETVLDLLLYCSLFRGHYEQLLDYLRSENSPLSYVDFRENSWNDFLLLQVLFQNLWERGLLLFSGGRFFHLKYRVPQYIATKLEALASSSSSTSVLGRPLPRCLVRHGRKLKHVDMAEWNQDFARISFADNFIEEILLPPGPPSVTVSFPNLSTLLLQDNRALQEIPDDIFLYTPNLRVLDLSRSRIKTLPSTLSGLKNLRMLSLEGCTDLQTIDTTGFENIEVLNLRDCPLPALDKASWCHMSNLKHLRFKGGLCCLQELQLSLKRIGVFDEFDEILSENMPEPSQLQKCNIAILYPNEEDKIRTRSTPDVRFQASRFPYSKIHAKLGKRTGADVDYDKRLEINGGDGLWSLYTITGIFKPHFLSLSNYHNAQAGLWPNYVTGLKACYIKNCNDMEYVFNSPPVDDDELEFEFVLETLRISKLERLCMLYNFRFEQEWSFELLKSINVDFCPNLIVLFPSTVSLPSLEVMEVRFCARLGKLFAGETAMPRLVRLHLCGLPKLTSICDGGHLPSLRKMEIRGCLNLRKLPLLSSLASIRGEEEWWKNVEGVDKGGVDFKVGSVSAAQKQVPCAWRKGPRRQRHPPN